MQAERVRRYLGAAAMIAFVVLTGVTAARAASVPGARFVYETCDPALPGGNPPPMSFKNPNGGAMGSVQTCAAPGGAIGIVETGDAEGDPSWLEVGVLETPGGFVEAETISAWGTGWAEGNLQSHVHDNGFPPGNGQEWAATFHEHSQHELFFGSGGSFTIALDCNYGQACNTGAAIYAHYIAATEVDPTPPTLAGVAGSALSGAVLRGHQTLGAEAADLGGGLTSLAVLANGLPAAPAVPGACAVAQVSNRSTYGTVAASPTPCPPHLSAQWSLDTSVYPFHDGTNTVQVCATDFATLGSPNTTCSPAQTVTVDNSCTESPVPGGSQIAAGFAQSDTEAVTVGFGEAAEVTGSLHDAAGDPVPGATICVKSQTLETGEPQAPVAAVKTDAEGRFAYAVPAGPDREVMLGYRHDSFQIARQVRYFAHTAPSLMVDPPKLRNGGHIHLWGELPAPAAAGRVVVLQANVKGSRRWITFRRATTDDQGHFKSGYRFRSTTRRTIYRFRAIVPRQDHYPYVEGHSRPVHVVVRPHRHRPV